MYNESGRGPIPPQESKTPSETDEDNFYDYLEKIDDATKQTDKYKQIIKLAEDDGDYGRGLNALQAFIAKREAYLDKVTVSRVESEINLSPENIDRFMGEVRLTMSCPELFLGNGASAEVFTLRRSADSEDELVCAKMITDGARYAEGRTVYQEMRILDMMRDVRVDGVRSPVPMFAFSNNRKSMVGLVMEQLDAVNLRRVIEKQTTEGIKDELPAQFDIDDFFLRLKSYVKEMHRNGVIHNDLHLRNIMVDRDTSQPRVIDFGKAKLVAELDKTRTSPEDEFAKDMESLRLAEIELRNWLNGSLDADVNK
ncbi:MAG: protein kinase [Patescibacteria group bacterium]